MQEGILMNAKIISARRGIHAQYTNQYVVAAEGCKSAANAGAIVGKKITIKAGKRKTYEGKITSIHGTKGAAIASFSFGLPGQFLGRTGEIA